MCLKKENVHNKVMLETLSGWFLMYAVIYWSGKYGQILVCLAVIAVALASIYTIFLGSNKHVSELVLNSEVSNLNI